MKKLAYNLRNDFPVTMSFKCSQEIYNEIQSLCKSEKRHQSEIIRALIENAIINLTEGEKK